MAGLWRKLKRKGPAAGLAVTVSESALPGGQLSDPLLGRVFSVPEAPLISDQGNPREFQREEGRDGPEDGAEVPEGAGSAG
jgi:hypothetical protein